MNVDLFPFSFKKHKNKNVLENTILQSIVCKSTHCIRIQLSFWPLYLNPYLLQQRLIYPHCYPTSVRGIQEPETNQKT